MQKENGKNNEYMMMIEMKVVVCEGECLNCLDRETNPRISRYAKDVELKYL